jgi:ADP-ribosyl-[dinitrogen reductase] hydrolase
MEELTDKKRKFYRAMLGAFVGDAAGATLEFVKRITPEMVREAMKMPGGGVWNVGPGQITDDGELTLAAWQHIHRFADGYGIPVTNLIRGYVEWFRSNPFDMGRTCSIAFGQLSKLVPRPPYGNPINSEFRKEALDNIKKWNNDSEANGALMRATALATWAVLCNINNPEIAQLGLVSNIAQEDAKLSHPNEVCVEVNKIYTEALFILLNDISPEVTLIIMETYVKNEIKSEKVKKWFFEESLNIDNLDCSINCGHVRYGFVMAIYFLRNPHITYEESIYQTLLKGGDTDTNACIVGGLVACYQKIPEYMLMPVIEFDCTKEGEIRPGNYSVKNMFNGKLSDYIYKYYNPEN